MHRTRRPRRNRPARRPRRHTHLRPPPARATVGRQRPRHTHEETRPPAEGPSNGLLVVTAGGSLVAQRRNDRCGRRPRPSGPFVSGSGVPLTPSPPRAWPCSATAWLATTSASCARSRAVRVLGGRRRAFLAMHELAASGYESCTIVRFAGLHAAVSRPILAALVTERLGWSDDVDKRGSPTSWDETSLGAAARGRTPHSRNVRSALGACSWLLIVASVSG